VTPAVATVAAGLAQQYSASGSYSDGSVKDLTESATWTSSDDTVAAVSGSGLASTLKQGSVTIKAALQSVSGTTSLNVSPAALASIAITPNTGSVSQYATEQLKATGTYTDGSLVDVSPTATWSSSSIAVSVNNSGLCRGLIPGAAPIEATIGSVSGSATLTVNALNSRYAYASSLDGSISEYAVDASSGRVTTLGYVVQPNAAYYPPTVESTRKYLFAVINAPFFTNPAIAAYQPGANGQLSEVLGSPFNVSNGTGLSSLTADPVSNILFGATQNGILPFKIDMTTAVTIPGTLFPANNIAALAIDPLGRFLFALQPTNTVGNILVFTIADNGSLTQIQGSPFPVPQPAFGDLGFVIDPTGRFLYELATTGISQYAVNSQTGALTSVGPLVAAGTSPFALAISPIGNELLVSNPLFPSDQIWAFTLDPATGKPSAASGSPFTLGSTQALYGTSFDASGKFAFAAENSYLETFSVDPSTWTLK